MTTINLVRRKCLWVCITVAWNLFISRRVCVGRLFFNFFRKNCAISYRSGPFIVSPAVTSRYYPYTNVNLFKLWFQCGFRFGGIVQDFFPSNPQSSANIPIRKYGAPQRILVSFNGSWSKLKRNTTIVLMSIANFRCGFRTILRSNEKLSPN